MKSSLVIPVTFWSSSQPTFRISSICVTPNLEKLVTGSFSGQLCLWDVDIKNGALTPRNILIGHKDSITCMVCTKEYVISCCESKRIFRWNMDDGYCSKMNRTSHILRKMTLFRRNDNDECVIACGDSPEIFIIHSLTLQVIFILHSSASQDWISSFQVKTSKEKGNSVFGITASGCVKFWTFHDFADESQIELKTDIISMTEIVDVKYNSNQTKLLIIAVKCFSVYDSEISNCLCKVEASVNEKLLGGIMLEDNVIIWTKSGKFNLYNVRDKESLTSVISDKYTFTSVFEPAFEFAKVDFETYIIKGDFWGKISIWKVDEQKNQLQPLLSSSLAEKWINESFFNSYVECSEITCCIYVLQLDKFFIGCHNGCIISIPATQSLMSFYFYSSTDCSDVFTGHNGKINCLLYPHEIFSHFNESHLVSGSSDFSVCLWDVYKVELLFKFCVQSGEILRLIVPPENCSAKVRFSICSVSLDNSVAILNLEDPRCVLLTSRHTFPVIGVHWRPLDDFIIVECFDGTVYVWEIETGHLDRVISGLEAQEALYACNENFTTTPLYNFYINKHSFRDNIKNKVLIADECTENPFTLCRFFIGNSESQIFLFDVISLLAERDCNLTLSISSNGISSENLVTGTISTELERKYYFEKLTKDFEIAQEFEFTKNNNLNVHSGKNPPSQNKQCLNDSTRRKLLFFLSAMHIWGLDSSLDEILTSKLGFLQPVKPVSFGLLSHSGVFSLFLPTSSVPRQNISSFVTSFSLSITAISKLLKCSISEGDKTEQEKASWEELQSFYEKICVNKETIYGKKIEILCKLWQNECLEIQKIAQKFLCKILQGLTPKENTDLLAFWYNYLPHFKILDKTSSGKVDVENIELKTVALVLFGVVGSYFKFKHCDQETQENYIYQTCASFVYLLMLPNSQEIHFRKLQAIAVEFIGSGYIIWEHFLKMEKIVPILLKMCSDLSKATLQFTESPKDLTVLDRYFNAQNALRSVAIARTAAFIRYLVNEINNIKLGRAESFTVENSKAEILSVVSHLLQKTPYFMLLFLSDVISLIIYCVDFSHLKQENLSNLLPAIQKFRQIHHSVTSQKIAVGLSTGSLIFHDTRTGKAVEVFAHKDSVNALKFSEDGKFLVSYSCYENKLSCWKILTGMFGLGQFQVKCTKSCQTYEIHDEEIKNHLEIASLTWTNKKSVLLSFCDGTKNVFEF